ncbi:MAG: DUF58 domain-containing protein [Parachlamydiaceae bacterium]
MIERTQALQHIRRLHIKALHNVEDLFSGFYRSAFKGKGLEFEDVREYFPGDDIRTIDWNVTARSQHPFVKNFREERELTVMLIVDLSASSGFSHLNRLKSDIIAELAAILAFSAIKNQDKVGLLLFTNEIELYLTPKKGVRHVLRVIRELLYFIPRNKGTDLSKALSFLAKVQAKHAICFLISDFLSDGFSKEAALIAKRHELIAFHVYDTYEETCIPRGLFHLRDLETAEEAFIDTDDVKIREQFEKKSRQKALKTRHLFSSIGADYLSIHTGEASNDVLQRFFKLRRRRT